MRESRRLTFRLLVLALLLAFAAPAIVHACMPAANGMQIMSLPVDATQELPGGG
jgi:hypothetical protein